MNLFSLRKSSLNDSGLADFLGAGVRAGYSNKSYDKNRHQAFLRESGVDAEKLFLIRQVHGAKIVEARRPNGGKAELEADGVWTDEPGIALGVLTADCLPVFFWHPRKRRAAVAHAGWRGLHAHILKKMVHSVFPDEVASLRVGIGPSIRGCCYEVGIEFKDLFPPFFEAEGQKGRVDLAAVAIAQLKEAGVAEIYDCRICTSCKSDTYFSARRGDDQERILSFIQKR